MFILIIPLKSLLNVPVPFLVSVELSPAAAASGFSRSSAANLGWMPAKRAFAAGVMNGPGGGSGLRPATASGSFDVRRLRMLKWEELLDAW